MKNLSLMILGFIIPILAISQTTSPSNTPLGGAYLGWSGAQNLDFKTNSILRMQLMQTSTYTVDAYPIDNSGFLGLSLDSHFFTTEPFSLLHLNGDNQGNAAQPWGYRPWMRPGITFTDNRDFMYIGPYAHGLDHTDAVIAWADNKNQDSNGPDVLRFIFTNRASGNTSTSTDVFSDSDIDGVEVGRMTGKGLTGLGSYWNNTYLPLRTLDVINQQDVPQFRITRQRSTTINAGTNTDFQVSAQGNLHILPRFNGYQKAVISKSSCNRFS